MFVSVLIAVLGCDGGEVAECSESDLITVFADNDDDSYGAAGTEKLVCPPVDENGAPTGEIPRGFSTNDDDCDDNVQLVNPGQIEECDGVDNDCDTETDEGLREITFFLDADGDGFGDPDLSRATTACGAPPGFVDNPLDCDDENSSIHPDAVEICDNDVDNDCDALADDDDFTLDLSTATTWYFDNDGDSFGDPEISLVTCDQPEGGYVVSTQVDCDDTDDAVNPNAIEVCNRYDDDCDQLIDDSDPDIDPLTQSVWYADSDNDGYGDPNVTTLACFQPWFHVTNTDDCDDSEPLLGLPAPWVLDSDNDGFGAGTPSADSCTGPTADHVLIAFGFDCDDSNPFTSPLGLEVCDGDDNDCDTLTDDADPSLDPAFSNTYYNDADNDSFGTDTLTVQGCTTPVGYSTTDTDCNDANNNINPGETEICDNIDNDCDSLIDDLDPDVDLGTAGTYWADFDSDGFGDSAVSIDSCSQPPLYTDNDLDCDDTDPLALVDGPWKVDTDGDGVGAGVGSADSCVQPTPGWVPSYYGTDCDNNDPFRFPGNFEICNNGTDEDCDLVDPPCAPPSSRWLIDADDRTMLLQEEPFDAFQR